jgi:hypothetical protein
MATKATRRWYVNLKPKAAAPQKEYRHVDKFSKELAIGDVAAIAAGSKMIITKVINATEKYVSLEILIKPKNWETQRDFHNGIYQRKPENVIRVDDANVTFWLLQQKHI